MDRYIALPRYTISHTDFVRFCVIFSLSLSSIFISSLALARNIHTITPQLFYFPIIYAAYFYRYRGIYVAGICAIAYQAVSYYYLFPEIFSMGYATGQAVLFICIAAAVSYFTEQVTTSEKRYRSIFENSHLGIVFFNQDTLSIILANGHLAKMLGYSQDDIGKMTLPQLFVSRDELQRFLKQFGSHNASDGIEARFVTKNGDPFWVSLSWGNPSGNLASLSVIDINQQKITLQTATTYSTHNRLLMETAPTGMVIIRNSRIIRTNPVFTAFSGYKSDELTGTDLVTVVHPDDRKEFRDIVSRSKGKTQVLGNPEFRFITKSGGIKRATLFFNPIMEGGIPSVLITFVDISERESLKEQIRLSNERRRGVITNVAHELRTPLQPIIGYLDMLIQDPEEFGISKETKKILGRCLQSADRERRIINKMIDFSVIDSGKLPMDYSVFSVPELLKNIINASGYSMKADIFCEIPQDLTFTGDAHKISIVADSILSNAVNYSTPPRKVSIIYNSSAEDTYHRLAIGDNGIGITEAQLDEIFEPFQLADSGKLSRKYERIGLSLSIAKKYIQMHGGYISVDSVVNQGSTFTLHIPKVPHEEVVTPQSFELWL
jgi:PAS domain S-box-containing protein